MPDSTDPNFAVITPRETIGTADLAPPADPPSGNRLSQWFDGLPPRWRAILTGTLSVASSMLLVYLSSLLHVPVPVVPPVPDAAQTAKPDVLAVVAADNPPGETGWNGDPELIAAARAQVRTVFRATPAGETADADLPDDVFQWEAYRKAFGVPPPIKDQGPLGSCVPFGTGTAVERCLACAILGGRREKWTRFSEEATYGGSRVEVGGGQLRGQEGSTGGWAAKWWTEYGGCPRAKYPTVDLSAYNVSLCRQWGDSGVPAPIEAECAKFKVGDAALLKTWLDCKKALAAGSTPATCSIQGFTMVRDANGVCKPSGRWGHCMCLDGYHVDKATGKEYGHFENSWGTAPYSGPTGWGNPDGAGFWAESGVIAKMLAEGDSYAYSAAKGFPKIPLDWFAVNDAAPRLAPLDRLALTRPNRRQWAVSDPEYALAP